MFLAPIKPPAQSITANLEDSREKRELDIMKSTFCHTPTLFTKSAQVKEENQVSCLHASKAS